MLNTRQIIALQEIKGCGAATIRQFVTESQRLKQESLSDSDFMSFINGCISSGLKRCRLKLLSKLDFNAAVSRADMLIEKSERQGIEIVSYVDPSFPCQLLDTINEDGKSDVPLVLYYKGDLSITKMKGIAIVGTREPTKEGVTAGELLGKALAGAGYNIVSGLAIGCDTAGHRGALNAPDGKTTAFLGHGLDSMYPPENEMLANEIVEKGGLLMSEYAVGEIVNRYSLVARDRLQAALSAATIVIQTGVLGGTNHAANTTLASGKPLFCVKYRNEALMQSEKVEGNMSLVSKGAEFITSANFMELIAARIGEPISAPSKPKCFPEVSSELLLFGADDF